jgi:hypothetical protein
MAFSASDLHIFAAAGLLALVHLFGGQLRFLQAQPRSIWLSLGGGISVAYVFIHLLPKLQQHQQTLRQAFSSALASLHHHAYLIALLGLTVFYGLNAWRYGTGASARMPGKKPPVRPCSGSAWAASPFTTA